MRKFSLFLLGSSLLFLTSCFDIIEDIYLNKDGSGKYVAQFDMSSLMDNPFMKNAIEEAATKKGEEAMEMEQDSIMYFKDSDGFSALTADEQQKLDDVYVRMQISEKDKKMLITMNIPFQSFAELEEINAVMQKLEEQKSDTLDTGGLMGGGNPFKGGLSPSFKLEKRKLIRLAGSSIKDMFGSGEDDLSMVKMFLEGATSTTIYHLPGKVKKCTIPGAVVDGKTVTVKSDLLEILDEKVNLEGYIKYKKR